MSKIYCDKADCPALTCDRHLKQAEKIKGVSVASFEGTLLCIKALNKSKGADALPVPTESQEQQALFEWADRLCFKYPELALLHHIPNEGKRSKTTGRKLKREGMKSGVPDIHLPVARGKFHSLYIELKRRKGSSTSKEQEMWLQLLGKYGNKAIRCYGWEEAAKVIVEYLEIKE
jgi:hypothetical protein